MHKVRVNHRVNTSMFFYLDNLLNAPIEIQINRIGDDIVKKNNKLTGINSDGFRYKRFTYNEGYQTVLHPSLHDEAKAMQEWVEETQNQLRAVRPLLHALSKEDISKETINYFIPEAITSDVLSASDITFKNQVERLEKEYPTEIMALNLLKIGALLV